MTKFILVLTIGLVGCSGPQTPVDDPTPEAGASLAVTEAVLTTGVDIATFTPTGTTGTVFPSSTRQLYLCLRIRAPGPAPVVVQWYRAGDEEPISSSRLVVTSDRWAAAEYEALGQFETGRYVVRADSEGEPLVEIEFDIEDSGTPSMGAAPPAELSVNRIGFVRELGDDGRPQGPITTLFPAGSREVHCAFSLANAPQGSAVAVRWYRGSELIRTSDLGLIEGDRDLQASLRAGSEALSPGLYRAEVIVNGSVVRSSAFTVEAPYPSGGAGPRVTNLVLTTAVEPATGLPAAPSLTSVLGDEQRLYLSMTFSRMPPDEVLEVRWIRGVLQEAETFAVSRFQVGGRGSLAAELTPDSPLEIGQYRVEVILRGQVMGTLPFVVDRPVPPSDATDEE